MPSGLPSKPILTLTMAAALVLLALAGISPPLSGAPESKVYQELLELDAALQRAVEVTTPSVVAVHAYLGTHQASGGVGSGVIIDSRGWILTCAHVVQDSSNVKVVTADGHTYPVRVAGANERADFALLEIDAALVPAGGFTAVPRRSMVTEPVEIGEWVFALGHPGGPNIDKIPAASVGRITGLGKQLPRELGTRVAGGLFQTDLPITSGSSGGPLLDARGRLLGLSNAVSLIDDRAFAVPFTAIRSSAQRWIEAGDVRPSARLGSAAPGAPSGFIGVRLQNMATFELAGLGLEGGVRVLAVAEGGRADIADLRPGDVLTAFAGEPVQNVHQAGRVIASCEPGKRRLAEIYRDGKRRLLPVAIGEREQ